MLDIGEQIVGKTTCWRNNSLAKQLQFVANNILSIMVGGQEHGERDNS